MVFDNFLGGETLILVNLLGIRWLNHVTETKIYNYMKNVHGTICDKIGSITVIQNLVRPTPIKSFEKRAVTHLNAVQTRLYDRSLIKIQGH